VRAGLTLLVQFLLKYKPPKVPDVPNPDDFGQTNKFTHGNGDGCFADIYLNAVADLLVIMGLIHLLSAFSVLPLAIRQCSCFSSHPTSSREFSMQSILESKDLGSSNYLARYVSSPERYADALNLTVQEVAKRKEQYRQASETLHRQLMSTSGTTSLTGVEKHTLLCQHRFQYGQHPFACSSCWSYNPVCICDVVARRKSENASLLLP
jgi:hypothetical protein